MIILNKRILSALIGLAGAINNNGKTADTDSLVREALLSGDEAGMVERIHREKHRISPGCVTCQSPCGNTSDYPLPGFDSWPDDTRPLKQEVMAALRTAALADGPLPEMTYQAIAYLGYDL